MTEDGARDADTLRHAADRLRHRQQQQHFSEIEISRMHADIIGNLSLAAYIHARVAQRLHALGLCGCRVEPQLLSPEVTFLIWHLARGRLPNLASPHPPAVGAWTAVPTRASAVLSRPRLLSLATTFLIWHPDRGVIAT